MAACSNQHTEKGRHRSRIRELTESAHPCLYLLKSVKHICMLKWKQSSFLVPNPGWVFCFFAFFHNFCSLTWQGMDYTGLTAATALVRNQRWHRLVNGPNTWTDSDDLGLVVTKIPFHKSWVLTILEIQWVVFMFPIHLRWVSKLIFAFVFHKHYFNLFSLN